MFLQTVLANGNKEQQILNQMFYNMINLVVLIKRKRFNAE